MGLRRQWAECRARRDREALVKRVRPYSMVLEPALNDLILRVREVVDQRVEGDLVECGTWHGGSAFLMAEVLRRVGEERRVWMFDSFEGLPPPKEIDGPDALAYPKRSNDDPWYFDNCRVDIETVRANAQRLGLEQQVKIVPGWFDQTLPKARESIGPIALLRLDCDWYDSVKLCLETLYDQVADGGLVILDDYHVWDGCTIAVHEFLAERKLPHRIHTIAGVAMFKKA